MNIARLAEVIEETTSEFRKGDVVTTEQHRDVEVTHVYAMDHVDDAPPNLEKVDVHFMVVGVDKKLADERALEVRELLRQYPDQERLAGGPSYIEVGAVLGSQDLALRLFALGQALEFWTVVTPGLMGITGSSADELAGNGMVMCSGYTEAVRR